MDAPTLVGLGGIAVLLAAELGLRRWRDPLARDRSGDYSQLPAATRRLSPRALRHAYRIVVLGDSIPFGWPLSTRDGYPARLEALLRARYPGRSIAVINAGIGGHTAVMGLARVERDLVRWRPHLALIAFGLNDCHLARTSLDSRREQWLYARRRLPARLRDLLRRSALLSLLVSLGHPDRPSDSGGPALPAPGVCDRPQPRVSPAAYVEALRALVRTARRAGAQPCLLTMTPLGPAALASTPISPAGWHLDIYWHFDRLLRAVAAEEGVPLIDVQSAFPTGPGLERFLARDGVHLTAEGQALLAEAIARHAVFSI